MIHLTFMLTHVRLSHHSYFYTSLHAYVYLDDISDNMDDEGTLNTRRAVIESLRDPAFDTNARVGKMTKESVFL